MMSSVCFKVTVAAVVMMDSAVAVKVHSVSIAPAQSTFTVTSYSDKKFGSIEYFNVKFGAEVVMQDCRFSDLFPEITEWITSTKETAVIQKRLKSSTKYCSKRLRDWRGYDRAALFAKFFNILPKNLWIPFWRAMDEKTLLKDGALKLILNQQQQQQEDVVSEQPAPAVSPHRVRFADELPEGQLTQEKSYMTDKQLAHSPSKPIKKAIKKAMKKAAKKAAKNARRAPRRRSYAPILHAIPECDI